MLFPSDCNVIRIIRQNFARHSKKWRAGDESFTRQALRADDFIAPPEP
jgi:hypothetical protein